MNVMMATGGSLDLYPVEERSRYLPALDRASVGTDLYPVRTLKTYRLSTVWGIS